jgi:hypothetical protein
MKDADFCTPSALRVQAVEWATMKARLAASCLLIAIATMAAAADRPSRAAFEKCAWEKLSDEKLGLAVWVQRCDYGSRKIDFVVEDHGIAMRYSDGGKPERVIEVFDLQSGESATAGLRRIFDSRTKKAIAKRCVLATYATPSARPGVKRYSFVPDKAYRRELDAAAQEGIPDPPCGDLGDQPDFIQYFEVQPESGSRKVLLVITGQDTPLFDEETLRLLPAKKR